MGWGEPHARNLSAGSTGEIEEAHAAFDKIHIKYGTLAARAKQAAQIISNRDEVRDIVRKGGGVFNYRLTNVNGDAIGVVSLETEDLPKLLMAGEKLILSGAYHKGDENDFLYFTVSPEPAVEQQRARIE